MDAIEMLVKDHQAAKRAMEDVARSSGAKKRSLFDAFKRDLEAHDRLEELVFYPALKAIPKAAGFAEKHAEAHEGMEQAMSQLDGLPMDDVDWAPIFRSMQDHLLKHVVDEESHLFAKLRKLLSPQELDALSERMHAAIPPLPLPA